MHNVRNTIVYMVFTNGENEMQYPFLEICPRLFSPCTHYSHLSPSKQTKKWTGKEKQTKIQTNFQRC